MTITQLKNKLKKHKESQITLYEKLYIAYLKQGDLPSARRYCNLAKRLRKQLES